MNQTSTSFDKVVYLDAEYTRLNRDSTFISLALVADTGEEFYAEFTDFNKVHLSDWVSEHVLGNLFLDKENQHHDHLEKLYIRDNTGKIKTALERWLYQFGGEENSLQIWGDCPPWDWMLFCDLFGGGLSLPDVIHYMPMDLATLFYLEMGDPDISREEFAGEALQSLGLRQHNALYDAHLIKASYEKLMQ